MPYFVKGKHLYTTLATAKTKNMRTDYVIYHKGIAYTDEKRLSEAIGAKNANKAIYRALSQKVDVSIWKLRKCGKYEIHLK